MCPGAQETGEQVDVESCRCGHAHSAHEHFRPGSECSLCGPGDCKRFQRARSLTGLLAAFRGRTRSRRERSDAPGQVLPLPTLGEAATARTNDDGDSVAREA